MSATFDICVTGPFEPATTCSGPELRSWNPNELTIANILKLVVQPPNYLNIYNPIYYDKIKQ
jgi:hypothetical protein